MLNGAVEDGGRIAKISAVIGNTNLRTTHMTVQLIELQVLSITTPDETETFTGSGARYNYKLKWPLDIRTDKVTITVDAFKKYYRNILQVTLMIVWVEHIQDR